MNESLRCRPILERLENRACPAFFAGLVNGNLVITATESVGLVIEQLDADSFGVYENNSGTSAVIDGVTKDLKVRLSENDDYVDMALWGQTAPGDIRVNLGDGNNSLNLSYSGGVIPGDLIVRGGSGSDQLLLGGLFDTQMLRVLGRTNIHTSGGNDVVQLGDQGEARFENDIQIHLGDGDDALYTTALFFSPATAHGGCGHDLILGSHVNLTVRGFEQS
jgi:hypothetical protein